MSITQEQADKIVADIEKELEGVFIDRSNIDFEKAVQIQKYCDKRLNEHDVGTQPVQYAYWLHLSRKYKKTVEITTDTIKKYSAIRQNRY